MLCSDDNEWVKFRSGSGNSQSRIVDDVICNSLVLFVFVVGVGGQ